MFVAPDAPSALPSDILGGRQWFPLSERTPQEYRIGAEAVHPLLDQYLDAELAALNLPGDALALVGFSQGAMCALHCGLRRKTPPSAIVGYSGLLPGASTGGGQLDGIQTSTPVLIVHGAQDDVVPAYHADAAGQALSAAGVANTVHVYDNLGHSIDERGMRAAGLFLKEAFGMPG
ncbi:alpha/beta fold hydrolase [Roseibium denhamense]